MLVTCADLHSNKLRLKPKLYANREIQQQHLHSNKLRLKLLKKGSDSNKARIYIPISWD